MNLRIKNYTSGSPVSSSVSKIEDLLARAGASAIAKQYVSGQLDSLVFKMPLETGREVNIRLPANHGAVFDVMWGEVRKPHKGTEIRVREQALRTSWKLIQDWLEVQLSLIQMGQAERLQVFLPYVWNGRQSFYEQLKETRFKALLPEKTE